MEVEFEAMEEESQSREDRVRIYVEGCGSHERIVKGVKIHQDERLTPLARRLGQGMLGQDVCF